MGSAATVLFQIVVMFILIIFGVICYKLKIITNAANKQLSNLILLIVTPVLLFVSYQKTFSETLMTGLIISFVLAAVSHIILIAVGTFIIRKKNNKNWSLERFAAIYSNCGFMGIPLIEALYGTDGIFYLTAYVTVFNIMMWTHGVINFTDKKDFKSVLHILKSPTIISVMLGMILFFNQVFMPEIIIKPLTYIASLNTPLAMLVSGVTIAQTNVFSALKKPKIYLISLLKLFIGPVIAIFIFKLFNFTNQTALNTILIATACPPATATIMFAYRFKKDAVYGSEIFAASTLLSAVSLPLILMISSL